MIMTEVLRLLKKRGCPYIGKSVDLGRNIKIEGNICYIGDGCVIEDNVRIGFGAYVGNNCRIGHGSSIGRYAVLLPRTWIGCKTHFGSQCTSQGNNWIGNHVTINNQSQIGWGMVIEDRVFIGPRFVPSNTKNIKHGRNIPYIVEPSKIKFGARIGSGVTILPEVTIGREAFIGAGSVITKSIPDFMLAYGNPARVKREIPQDERLPEKLYNEYLKRKRAGKAELPSLKTNLLRAVRIVMGELIP